MAADSRGMSSRPLASLPRFLSCSCQSGLRCRLRGGLPIRSTGGFARWIIGTRQTSQTDVLAEVEAESGVNYSRKQELLKLLAINEPRRQRYAGIPAGDRIGRAADLLSLRCVNRDSLH